MAYCPYDKGFDPGNLHFRETKHTNKQKTNKTKHWSLDLVTLPMLIVAYF